MIYIDLTEVSNAFDLIRDAFSMCKLFITEKETKNKSN